MIPALVLAAEAHGSATVERLLEIIGLVLLVAMGAALARRLPVVAPLLLLVGGFVASFVPGVPEYRLDPEIVLVVILPPLLFATAWRTPVRAMRTDLRLILVLSIGLVLFTSVVVGLVASAVVPDLSLAAAIALGAIVAPPDAVAATAVASRAGLPPRLVSILEGESLLNDATALTTYRLAVAAVAGSFSLSELGFRFVVVAAGGLAVGLVAAFGLAWVRRHIDEPLLDTTLTLVGPYAAFLPAEEIGASGVVAVVITGLFLGHRWPLETDAVARLQAQAIWSTLLFLLEGVVFVLIGLQLHSTVEGLSGIEPGLVVGAAAAVVAAVVTTRFVWILATTYLARLVPRVRRRSPAPPWREPALLSWAGMRGVVSMAAAVALPADFPQRDLVIFLTFVVIVATLLLQGLSLPWVIRRLGIRGPSRIDLALQEAAVQQAAVAAARRRLDELLGDGSVVPPDIVARLREKTDLRGLAAWERLGSGGETPTATFRRLRREMLRAERDVFVEARNDGRIAQDAFLDVLRELDNEDVLLGRDARPLDAGAAQPPVVPSGAEGGPGPCAHVGEVSVDVTPDDGDGCPECRAQGDTWVHLRVCALCGHVGCCDSSPNRHATAHFDASGHPLIRSFEPGEDWWYCYPDERVFQLRGARALRTP